MRQPPLRDWVKQAACNPSVAKFFQTEQLGKPYSVVAKGICAKCPVRRACLNYAIVNDEPGIWGGLTEAERNRFNPAFISALKKQAQQEGWYSPPVAPVAMFDLDFDLDHFVFN